MTSEFPPSEAGSTTLLVLRPELRYCRVRQGILNGDLSDRINEDARTDLSYYTAFERRIIVSEVESLRRSQAFHASSMSDRRALADIPYKTSRSSKSLPPRGKAFDTPTGGPTAAARSCLSGYGSFGSEPQDRGIAQIDVPEIRPERGESFRGHPGRMPADVRQARLA